MRNTFIKTLIKLARKDKRVVLITPDLGFSVLEEFEKEFPERFFNVGIAESNAISIASGLALSGKIVYVYSIIPFVTMRAFEQVRVDVAYMNTNVRLVGVGAGLAYGPAGATHHSIEDIAIIRSLPNMCILAPSDPFEVEQLTYETLAYNGPIYIRLNKNGEQLISNTKKNINIGTANIIDYKKENSVSIIFTSNASDIAIKTKKILLEKNIQSDLISMHTLKPVDKNLIKNILENKKYIFTIEEHNIIGGLGSIMSEHIAESRYNPIFKRFALNDQYSHFVGSQQYIREKFNLTPEYISKHILDLMQ